MGFSRQEYWGELPFPSPGDLPDPGIKTRSPTLQADSLPSAAAAAAKLIQSCPTLCDPIDGSPPGHQESTISREVGVKSKSFWL